MERVSPFDTTERNEEYSNHSVGRIIIRARDNGVRKPYKLNGGFVVAVLTWEIS